MSVSVVSLRNFVCRSSHDRHFFDTEGNILLLLGIVVADWTVAIIVIAATRSRLPIVQTVACKPGEVLVALSTGSTCMPPSRRCDLLRRRYLSRCCYWLISS
jgi:hypothetical protein